MFQVYNRLRSIWRKDVLFVKAQEDSQGKTSFRLGYESQNLFRRIYRAHYCGEENRLNLVRVFSLQLDQLRTEAGVQDLARASRVLGAVWNRVYGKPGDDLAYENPVEVQKQAFLHMFAQGRQLSRQFTEALEKELRWEIDTIKAGHEPVLRDEPVIRPHSSPARYYAEGPYVGVVASLSKSSRIYHDYRKGGLLERTNKDLLWSLAEDKEERPLKVATILAGAAYRELDAAHAVPYAEIPLRIPSATGEKRLVPYTCTKHTLADGPIIFSLEAKNEEDRKREPGYLLFQGTTTYPSQSGSWQKILVDLHEDGVGKGVFDQEKEAVRSLLEDLTAKHHGHLPIISGHSLGGALVRYTMHHFSPMIQRAYAIDPPGYEHAYVEQADRVPQEERNKLFEVGSLDDPVVWCIGKNVSRNLRLVMGLQRNALFKPTSLDFLVIPVIFRKIMNNIRRFSTHMSFTPLQRAFLVVEIDKKAEDTRRHQEISPLSRLFYAVRPFFREFFEVLLTEEPVKV